MAIAARGRTKVPDGRGQEQSHPARKDPAPRPVGPYMPVLENTDAERFYVWSPPGSDHFESCVDQGYAQEHFGDGSPTFKRGRTGKHGDPIKWRDCVLLSCPKEWKDEEHKAALALAKKREQVMRDPRGLRRLAGEGSSSAVPYSDESDDGLLYEGRLR